ncbi:MAG: endonuclease III [Treponema sp.]|nr:endonuclease III [Treponema sp.]
MGKKKDIPWDELFTALESWRKKTLREAAAVPGAGGALDPVVTAMAQRTDKDPWAILAATILSLRTKDEVTAVTSARLLAKAPTPERLLSLSEEAIARLIYPAGFYRTKAASLKKIAQILLEQYQGKVPADMDELLALPGVGRKTANLVLLEAFDIDAICVDIHVHRISNRLGFFGPGGTADPEKTETALREILPKKYWKRINALLVFYGQQICRPVSPHCSRCVISGYCPRLGVEKSR